MSPCRVVTAESVTAQLRVRRSAIKHVVAGEHGVDAPTACKRTVDRWSPRPSNQLSNNDSRQGRTLPDACGQPSQPSGIPDKEEVRGSSPRTPTRGLGPPVPRNGTGSSRYVARGDDPPEPPDVKRCGPHEGSSACSSTLVRSPKLRAGPCESLSRTSPGER